MALGLGLAASLATTACAGRRVERLSAAGDHRGAIAQAEDARRPVRGEAARAAARSYVALDRFEAARAMLQRDFRRGGDLRSLVALARLELDAGLTGIGTAHYARAMELDFTAVAGDARACAAFVARARARHAQGDAVAADTDLRRAAKACGPPPSAAARRERDALWAEVRPAALSQVEQRRRLTTCPAGGCAPTSRAGLEEELAADLALARAEGPRALAALADDAVALPPVDVARLLDADLHGEATTVVVDDPTVARWAAAAPTAAIVAAADELDRRVGDYARLRLQRIRGDVALDGQSLARAREAWLLRASTGPGGWRALVVTGRLDEAELALVQVLRAQRTEPKLAADPDAEPNAAASGQGELEGEGTRPDGPGPVRPRHWAVEVPVDDISLPELLTLGVMLELRGRAQLGFELRRDVLARALAQDVEGARPRWREAVADALVQTRPWRAWMLAELEPGAEGRAAARVAAGQLNLLRAAGIDDQDGRAEAARIVGDDWVRERARSAATPERWRVAASQAAARDPSCGVRAAMLDDGDPLGAVLWRAIAGTLDRRGDGDLLAAAFEQDPALGCRGVVVGRALGTLAFDVVADRLAERYGHLSNVGASPTLEAFAVVSLAADRPRQAELWVEQAAALDPDPAALWRRAAKHGRELGAREYELHALRQQLLHGRDHAGLAVRRSLVVSRLADVGRPVDPEASVMAPTMDALVAALDEHFVRLPLGLRWGEAERILAELADRGVTGPAVAMRLTPALSPYASPRDHAAAWSRLLGIDGGFAQASVAYEETPETGVDAPIDPRLLDVEGRRRRLLERGVEPGAASSIAARIGALGVAPSSSASRPGVPAIDLLAALAPEARAEVLSLLLGGVASWSGQRGRAQRLLADDDAATDLVMATAQRVSG